MNFEMMCKIQTVRSNYKMPPGQFETIRRVNWMVSCGIYVVNNFTPRSKENYILDAYLNLQQETM